MCRDDINHRTNKVTGQSKLGRCFDDLINHFWTTTPTVIHFTLERLTLLFICIWVFIYLFVHVFFFCKYFFKITRMNQSWPNTKYLGLCLYFYYFFLLFIIFLIIIIIITRRETRDASVCLVSVYSYRSRARPKFSLIIK